MSVEALTAGRHWTADHCESWLTDIWRRLMFPERGDT
jgi:hypothetical protein